MSTVRLITSRVYMISEAVGRLVAAQGCGPGDVVLLQGGVGVGKSVLAQGFIREAVGDPRLVVPSPTFLRSNSWLAAKLAADICSIVSTGMHELMGAVFIISTCTDVKQTATLHH